MNGRYVCMTITWHEITYDDAERLNDAFTLYHQSFPMEVRETENIFIQSLEYAVKHRPNNYRFLVGYLDEELVSLSTAHYLADVNTGFIVYLVTNSMVRSRGLGRETLRKMEEFLNQDAVTAGHKSLKAIVLETEILEMLHTEEEKEDSIKRTRFFLKNEFRKYEDVNYLQPPIHQDGVDVPLHLFIKNLSEQELKKDEVTRIVRAMYIEKYHMSNRIEKHVLNRSYRKMTIEENDLFE